MYIGISAYNHESAVALINSSGQLVDYYREENLSRIKGDKSFPKKALKRIFERHKLNIHNIKRVAFYERPLSAFLHPVHVASKYMPDSLNLLNNQFRNFNKSSIIFFVDLAKTLPGLEKKIVFVDHHLSHTLTALSYSDSHEDICSVVVDGFGDRSTTSISYVSDTFNIKELWSCSYPVSIGLFYSSITDFLGFNINEGEFKVMGLSAYGDSNSKYAKDVWKLMYWDNTSKKLKAKMEYFDYHKSITNSFSKNLIKLLGEPRNPFKQLLPEDANFQKYADIAKGAQDLTIYLLSKIFEHAYSLTSSRKFLFSGGVALNSASLDSLAKLDFVDEIVVPPSPGDAGAAIGAAFSAYLKCDTNINKKIIRPSLFPSNYKTSDQIDQVKKIINDGFRFLSRTKNESLQIAADLIKEGHILGTLFENTETGPRALGNRSLICDGTNKKAVETLNLQIKNRSPFRPTAPAMKLETAKKYYELNPALITCYLSMTATCKCKPDSKAFNFPTTHVDSTARIQIVQPNSLLDQIIDELRRTEAEIEILANSSLNLSGDPTCFDLIDVLMVSSLRPLKYIYTDFGILRKKT